MQTMVNGRQMTYTDEGEGLPLLFVHGFPLNRNTWARQVERFKGNYRVIAPDLRGLGGSEASIGPVSMDEYAEDIYALLQYLATGPVILIGHSMGGYVAMAFARAYPKALRGLVLVSTKAGGDSPEAAATRRMMVDKVRVEGPSLVARAMAPRMLSVSNLDPAMAASVDGFMAYANPEGIIGALLGMAERPDAGPGLGKIRVPTLVVTGADDTLIPPGESEALAGLIPGAKLKTIPHAGHLVAFESADTFNEVMSNWLAWGGDAPLRSMAVSVDELPG